jgi:hypothetical protein
MSFNFLYNYTIHSRDARTTINVILVNEYNFLYQAGQNKGGFLRKINNGSDRTFFHLVLSTLPDQKS